MTAKRSSAGTSLLRAAGARVVDLSGGLDFSQISILIVDDNEFIRTLVTQMCRAVGMTNIIEADDAAEAFKALQRTSVDLVLCDYLMSPLNGIELVKLIRTAQDSTCQDVPIIMMTGHTEQENVIQARDAGVTELLAKPLSAKTLLSRIVHVFAHPRPFIRSARYTGPCRRKKFIEWHGEERRGQPRRRAPAVPDGTKKDSVWGLSEDDAKQVLTGAPGTA